MFGKKEKDQAVSRSVGYETAVEPPTAACGGQHLTVSAGARPQAISRQSSLLPMGVEESPSKQRAGWPPMVNNGEGGTTRRRSRSFLGFRREEAEDGVEEELEIPPDRSLMFIHNQWKFGDKIGQGAFGSVWLAVFKGNDRTYAIKKIKRRDENSGLEDTAREVQLMAQMSHKNIVRYYGGQAVTPGSYFWIVMEFMKCGTISDVMKFGNGPLKEMQARVVVRDVGQGLGYLHQMGVLHKDIKCENILVSAFGVCKLADFGVSQKAGTGTPEQHLGGGTLPFMAPEVVKVRILQKFHISPN